jgi:hypothetical protein
MSITNNTQYVIKSDFLQFRVRKYPIDGQTHGHTTMHCLELLNKGCNNQSLFIQFKPVTWHHKKGYKTVTCNSNTNKTMPNVNNKQSTTCH